MEHVAAEGRYICSATSCAMAQLTEILSLEYPSCSPKRIAKDHCEKIPSIICSMKLTSLGFKFCHDLADIIKHSVTSCSESGFLKTF
ncbi:putative dihydroflavanol 4-reductase [Dioscorea sansibarensis]